MFIHSVKLKRILSVSNYLCTNLTTLAFLLVLSVKWSITAIHN
ncbi:hypothetical protein SAMN04487937_1333 [Halorubrum sodomense]|uniref:Uncharacterized protein n=1 Tax=Halorubrum sodomense TaxID=35743 RepID=A0A1I6FXK2_HALSD|nr:hypothetical protein SAMN04487937_1333 [Halorubrum sodomense]